MISSLYVDDDGYICLDHTININVAFTWMLHRKGWEVYLGEVCVYDFDNFEVTYPTQKMFKDVENLISHFRYITPSGMWEVSYIDSDTLSRVHKLFDDFEDALTYYQSLKIGE